MTEETLFTEALAKPLEERAAFLDDAWIDQLVYALCHLTADEIALVDASSKSS